MKNSWPEFVFGMSVVLISLGLVMGGLMVWEHKIEAAERRCTMVLEHLLYCEKHGCKFEMMKNIRECGQ